MESLKILSFTVFTLITSLLNTCWKTLLFLVDLIDGGDEADSFPTDNNIRYNYRTGDIDPVKRLDGLYDNKP